MSTEAALHAPPAPAGPLASPVTTGRGHGSRGVLSQCGGTACGGTQQAGRRTRQTNSPVGRHGTRSQCWCVRHSGRGRRPSVWPSCIGIEAGAGPSLPRGTCAWRSQHGCSECRRNSVSTVCLHDTQQPPVMGPHFVTHTAQVRTTAAEESPQSQEWQRNTRCVFPPGSSEPSLWMPWEACHSSAGPTGAQP